MKCKVIHKTYLYKPMEYSMLSIFHIIWSTPYGRFLAPYWSALGFTTGPIPLPFGVLHMHMAVLFCHMEYSIWYLMECFRIHHRGHILFTIWSTPLRCFMTPQMSASFTIDSTPYGCFRMPYRVLHMSTIYGHTECYIEYNTKLLSTPYVNFWCQMDYCRRWP